MNQYNLSGLHIDPKVFQHPTDKAITDRIQNSKAFSTLLDFISDHGLEDTLYSIYLSSFAHMTKNSAPELIRMCEEAAEMFGAPTVPELFLTRLYSMFSRLQGIHKPVILLSTEIVNNLSPRACWAAIASNTCCAKSGYSQIDMIDWTLNEASDLLPAVLRMPANALQDLIMQWKKVSQLTQDRAALLAAGDLNTAMETILGGEMPMKVLRSINFADPSCGYMQQCREFIANQGAAKNVLRSMEIVNSVGAMNATRYIELFDFYYNEYEDLVEEYAD